MQGRNQLIAAVLIALVFVSSAIAYGASVNDPAWEKIVGAGKKEAKVVVFGPPGADVRDAYTIGFQKKYPEIDVDFNGMQGAQVAPKLLAELKAQQYRSRSSSVLKVAICQNGKQGSCIFPMTSRNTI
ncbi:MAG: hypothetical protein E6J73_06500 [Deltaproteobacteria bacterium]|nr:MAG: hypothetical protein E6J73_06500 [Deltaproteobacteria bacterium]